MEKNAVGWFEIPVTDMARAKKFYEATLGIELALNEMGDTEMAWFPMHHEAAGSTGSLCKGENYKPSQEGTTVYLMVDEVEAFLGRVTEAGGTAIVPKSSIGEHGFIGQFIDTEGNRVACHSME